MLPPQSRPLSSGRPLFTHAPCWQIHLDFHVAAAFLSTTMNPSSVMKSSNVHELSSDEDASIANSHPLQGKFNCEQKAFLMSFLEQYLALDNLSKGSKKAWVKSNVYYVYIEKYKSDGPNGVNLSSLLTVCREYYFHCRMLTNSSRKWPDGLQTRGRSHRKVVHSLHPQQNLPKSLVPQTLKLSMLQSTETISTLP